MVYNLYIELIIHFKGDKMNKAQLKALREIAEKNIIYNEETKTLTIKYGKMKGTYLNINKNSAIEIAKSN